MNEFLSLESFVAQFNTEEACADYLFQVKWPNGFICPRCDHRHFYKTTTRRLPLFECAQCRHQTSLTVGTVMEGSRTLLQKWFIAIYLLSQSLGINSLQLSKKIQVTYKTAWTMLHKIRHAMGEEDGSVLLSGFVQVNDACYNKQCFGFNERQPQEHPVLIGATMSEENEPLYVKIKLLDKDYLRGWTVLQQGKDEFVAKNVQSETSEVTFITGLFKSWKYKQLAPIFAETKRWIRKTFRGLGIRHLQAYFNEFCCRVNLHWQKAPIFGGLIQLCTRHEKVTYQGLINKVKRGMTWRQMENFF